MKRPGLIRLAVAAFALNAAIGSAQEQPAPPIATFKSAVEIVRIAAVVRDRKGRFIENLTARDFEVLEGPSRRPILDFRRDADGISLALLFDISGSMEARLPEARETAAHLFSWLDAARDETAVLTFDTQLVEAVPFTVGLKALPHSMSTVVPFGATSLRDAIAQAAQRVGRREGRRRGVAVLTDGNDTASRLTPEQVAAIASAIDVPVYIVGLVAGIDNPDTDEGGPSAGRALGGSLDDLATATGGRVFIVSSISQRSVAARQVVDELRHQYLIAVESSGKPGWHPLVVRARDKDLSVRARGGYVAGQSRPQSF